MGDQNNITSNKKFQYGAPLLFTRFDSSYLGDEYYGKGEKINHSPGGLSFKTSVSLKPGEFLLIKMDSDPSKYLGPNAWEGYRSITMAKVEECRPIYDEPKSSYFINTSYYNSEH